MISQALNDIGLSPNESKIYLSLVSNGPNPATSISKSTGLHRANVYSSLGRLVNRGLITSSKIDRHELFSANNPDVLLLLIKEKEDLIREILPQLALKSSLNKSLDVELISGLTGTINSIFSLQSLTGEVLFVGNDFNIPIGLSAKLSLFFSQEENLTIKHSPSDVLIFCKEEITLLVFKKELKTLKIVSKDLVDILSLLMF